jgi:hypothetical protein
MGIVVRVELASGRGTTFQPRPGRIRQRARLPRSDRRHVRRIMDQAEVGLSQRIGLDQLDALDRIRGQRLGHPASLARRVERMAGEHVVGRVPDGDGYESASTLVDARPSVHGDEIADRLGAHEPLGHSPQRGPAPDNAT